MYGRAPRPLTEASGSTTQRVGPGTYEYKAIQFGPKKTYGIGFAPFNSMSGRNTFLDVDDQVVKAPGPGQYDPGFAFEHIKGGRSLESKTERFKTNNKGVPGPGSYVVNKSSDWIKNSSRTKAMTLEEANNSELHQNALRPKTDQPTVRSARVKFSRQHVAPSIPAQGQAYGFEVTEEGFMVPHSAPEIDGTIGPAYYFPVSEETETTKRYRGCHFGTLTGGRTKFKGKDGPGPCEYQSNSPQELIVMLQDDRSSFRPPSNTTISRLPRYHEIVALDNEKKAIPSPAAYNIPSQFETLQDNNERPAFGCSATRFQDPSILTPAPGSYDDPRTSLEAVKRLRGLKRTPFNLSSTRFMPEHHIRETPGPGAYDNSPINTLSVELSRKALLESCRKGAFGSTSARVLPLNTKKDSQVPGPGNYDPSQEPTGEYHSVIAKKKTANFVSTSKRLHSPPPIVKDIPPPGSYEVATSYEATHGKEAAKFLGQTSGPFLSTAKRFQKPKDPLPEYTEPGNPGPGSYEITPENILSKPGVKKTQPSGTMVTRSTRFKLKDSTVPGPGAYTFSPGVASSVLKGTYNSTLENPISKADNMGVFLNNTAKTIKHQKHIPKHVNTPQIVEVK